MTPSRRLISATIAALGLAALVAAPAHGKLRRQHATHARTERPTNFPVYVDRGSDRNPGGDNLYFSDTKRPNYVVGPAWFQRWQ